MIYPFKLNLNQVELPDFLRPKRSSQGSEINPLASPEELADVLANRMVALIREQLNLPPDSKEKKLAKKKEVAR